MIEDPQSINEKPACGRAETARFELAIQFPIYNFLPTCRDFFNHSHLVSLYLASVKYFVKTPWWLKKIYGGYTWSIPVEDNKIYLSFDDGPHPLATPFVLDLLKQYGATGSFFCIGKNVLAHPAIYQRILDEGHTVGNHTQHHLNGWKTADAAYVNDVAEAQKHIDSRLFRPPYGRISSFQARQVKTLLGADSRIVMWDVISGDFDVDIDNERCLQNVILNAGKGSIVVFHDSEKAFEKLKYTLPRVLQYFDQRGYQFCGLNEHAVPMIAKEINEGEEEDKRIETGRKS